MTLGYAVLTLGDASLSIYTADRALASIAYTTFGPLLRIPLFFLRAGVAGSFPTTFWLEDFVSLRWRDSSTAWEFWEYILAL